MIYSFGEKYFREWKNGKRYGQGTSTTSSIWIIVCRGVEEWKTLERNKILQKWENKMQVCEWETNKTINFPSIQKLTKNTTKSKITTIS